jgi:hypothetical protein
MSARLAVPGTAAALTGGGRFLLAGIVALFSLFVVSPALAASAPAVPVESDALARVQALVKGGATQLALTLIDQNQPDISETDAWIQWEKQRYALLRAQHQWSKLAERVLDLPEGLPPGFVLWAKTEAVRASLEAQDADGARRILRGLLWSGQGDDDMRAEWRQLVIRSYLLDDNVADARVALGRYREDYEANTPAWRQLEATILIRAGRAKQAYLLVGDIKTYEGRLLTLLAGLRSNVLTPAAVLTRARSLAEETRSQPAFSHQAWMLAAEASGRANNSLQRMYALERALTGARQYASPDHLLTVKADDLWRAYDRYAEKLGNDARMLVGDDDAWLKKAESWKRDDAMQARAFYAFLTTHAGSDETRALAVRRLTESLIEDGRVEVLRALYAASTRYPDLASVPDYVRYRLADQALADFDIDFAGRIMRGLDKAPDGEDADNWTLRRARILTYAGKYSDAAALLNGLLIAKPKIGDAFAERYLQVIFDLQGADQHVKALGLLGSLFQQAENPRTQREILYWMADSRLAMGEYQRAAELYLRSAVYNTPLGGDMWGQTARFHAAEALAKAGLIQDARQVYQKLLKYTEDARQRAVIERNIQQLWLIERKSTTP